MMKFLLENWKKFLGENIDIVYCNTEDSEDCELEYHEQAWALAKESSINILSDKDLKAVAVMDSKVVGAVFDAINNNKYSWDTIVHPDYQRRGVAKKLIDFAMQEKEDLSDAYGGLEYDLDVTNPHMRAYLKQLGFIGDGRSMTHIEDEERKNETSEN